MRILIVSQYFWPESFRINELGKSLLARGVELDVLTGKPNYPGGKIYPGYQATGCTHEFWHGVNIFRVPLFPRGFKSVVRLNSDYLPVVFGGGRIVKQQLRNIKTNVIFVYAP